MRENQLNNTTFILQEELAKNYTKIDLTKEAYEAGGIPLYVNRTDAYIDTSDTHSVIYGATGSRKTRALVMPMIEVLLRAGESFVVTDPKGEIFERTGKSAQNKGYEVVYLNMRNPNRSFGWNPFSLPHRLYHSGRKSEAFVMVDEIANMLCEEDSMKEKFWSDGSKTIISGLILALIDRVEEEQCTIKNLISIWDEYMQHKSKMRRFFEEVFSDEKLIYSKLSSMFSDSEKTVGSFEAIISSSFNKLTINNGIMNMLSSNELKIDHLKNRKLAIYLIVPDETTATHFVASLFIKQIYQVLIAEAQQNENRLAVRMNFVLDEFGNLPRIPDMSNMITAARSRNIRFYLVVQGKKQIESKYESEADTLIGNCSNWLYLYSREYDLLSEISELCGEVIYHDGIRMPLISTFDLQHLSKENCECLVLAQRNMPCIANLADIDTFPFEKLEPLNTPFRMREDIVFDYTQLKKHDAIVEPAPVHLFDIFPQKRNEIGSDLKYLIGVYKGNVVAEGLCEDTDFGRKRIYYEIHHTLEEYEKVIWQVEDFDEDSFRKTKDYRLRSLIGNENASEITDFVEENKATRSICKVSAFTHDTSDDAERVGKHMPIWNIQTEFGMLDFYLILNYSLRYINKKIAKVEKYTVECIADREDSKVYHINCQCTKFRETQTLIVEIIWSAC